MNRKGFMLAELLITATIIMTAIIGLYSSFSKIYSNYETRLNYYDIDVLYRLDYYRQILISNGVFSEVIDEVKQSGAMLIFHGGNTGKRYGLGSDKFPLENSELPPLGYSDTVFLVKMTDSSGNPKELDSKIFENELDTYKLKLSESFKNYIEYFNDTVDTQGFKYIMLIERSGKDIDDNKYSYIYFDEEGNTEKNKNT